MMQIRPTLKSKLPSVSGDPPPMLEIRNLSLSYGQKVAFQGVNLELRPGQISALIGPSGCGKSSFLSCLNRLSEMIPNAIVSGTTLLDNQNILTLKVIELRRRVGMLFQKPNPFPLSIYRNIEFPLREHGVRDRHQLDAIVESVLQDVGLWSEVKDRLKSPALSLSGGQQQRLCLARALALKPDALLMDEPCSALDPLSTEVIENLILRLRDHYTVLVVTHNLAQAKRVADDVAMFWFQDGAGRLIESGSVAQIFEAPQHPLTQAYVSGQRG